MLELFKQPWPWYVTGPLIGLVVPGLLILGNKSFGISSTLRHICAACFPANIAFFNYNWRKEIWNLFFVSGILIGGFIAWNLFTDPEKINLHASLITELKNYGIRDYKQLVPVEIFSWRSLLTLKGFVMVIIGGFLVGFGTRYAGGCTSGHSIMGLSNLQWPSLIATICFMVGGVVVANYVLPLILNM